MNSLIEGLAIAAEKRIRIADENRKNGVKDPLNDLADDIQKIIERGGESIFSKPIKKVVHVPRDTRSKRQKRLEEKRKNGKIY